MKSLTLLLLSLLLSCGRETTEEKFARECPYKKEYTVAAHQLQVPIKVIPHKLKYQVGDTVSFVVDMSDTIHDLNTDQNFKVENFPFRPLGVLYRFFDGVNWDDGFQKIKYIVDSSNFIRTDGNGSHPQAMLLKYNYANNRYKLTLKLVLTEKGRYLIQFQDLVNDLRSDSEEYKKIKAFAFPGKCPTFTFLPCNTIVGDDQLTHFEPELLYIDKVEFYDNWGTIKIKNSSQSPYGSGSFAWEFNGTFGFEVH
jgi:hypothetical protein